jgi:pimeloyl-ACP methyl ester carboxylesterase
VPLREVNGVRLNVEESGSGEPLVLVHGSWDERRSWGLVEPELARRFHVVSYDRRGHTGSEDGAEPGLRRDDEDDLAALIEELGLAPAHVAANSFGAAISLGLASRRPGLFRTLCVHEPPLVSLAADDPAVVRAVQAMGPILELCERGEAVAAARGFVEDIALGPGAWALLPAELRASMAANAETAAGEVRDPAWGDVHLDALCRVDVPILLTQGDRSPPFFSRIVARLDEAVDGAAVRTIHGAGHVPHATHPEEYVALVSEFAAAYGVSR